MRTFRDDADYGLVVNGESRAVHRAEVGASLLTVLREHLGLTGTKEACSEGACGACSVLVDGVLVNACLVLGASVAGGAVTTIESYSVPDAADSLDDVQTALADEGAIQCGYCTPGLVVTVHDLLARLPDADDATVRAELCGNLCRCTGYGRIVAAVSAVQERRRND